MLTKLHKYDYEKLKKFPCLDKDGYRDFETLIDVAKILREFGYFNKSYLQNADELLKFLDNPEKYTEDIKEIIAEYEGNN